VPDAVLAIDYGVLTFPQGHSSIQDREPSEYASTAMVTGILGNRSDGVHYKEEEGAEGAPAGSFAAQRESELSPHSLMFGTMVLRVRRVHAVCQVHAPGKH
jgi:hypothetical protein